MDCEVAAQLNGAATILNARTTSVCFQTADDTLRELPLVRCTNCLSCSLVSLLLYLKSIELHVCDSVLQNPMSLTRTATTTASCMARAATCAILHS